MQRPPKATNKDILMTTQYKAAVPLTPEKLPRRLREMKVFITWKYVKKRGQTKPTKVPTSPSTGEFISATDLTQRVSIDDACEALALESHPINGLGIILSESESITVLDLDNCISEGEIDEWAAGIIERFDAYTELSPSGKGIRVIFFGSKPGSKCRKGHIEIYNCKRFVTVTGARLRGSQKDLVDRQAELEVFYQELFAEAIDPLPVQSLEPLELDAEDAVLAAADSDRSGRFESAFRKGDLSKFDEDRSKADFHVARCLATVTRGNKQLVKRLMLTSALRRSKWDRQDYLDRTIEAATEEALRSISCNEPTQSGLDQRLSGLPLTEVGNSYRFIARFGQDVRFNPKLGWLYYNGQFWERNAGVRVEELAKRTTELLEEELHFIPVPVDENGKPDLSRFKLFQSHIKASQRKSSVAGLMNLARTSPELLIDESQLDWNPDLLGVENGIVDLRTGQLRPHSREDLITTCSNVCMIEGEDCPTFRAFLKRVLPSKEVREYVRRVFGYCLSGHTSEQAFFLFIGSGANGKSTLIWVLQSLLAGYSVHIDSGVFMHRRDRYNATSQSALASLPGKRLVTTSEIDMFDTLNESLIKDITGGDKIMARGMYQDSFSFQPRCKVLLQGNHLPTIRGTDYGIWRRCKPVPFEVSIPPEEQDGELKAKLESELPGILNWALAGYRDWSDNGLAQPESIVNLLQEYREEEDLIGQFLTERTVEDPEGRASADALYQAFREWSVARGESFIQRQTLFGRKIGERHKKTKTGGKNVYLGITLSSEFDF